MIPPRNQPPRRVARKGPKPKRPPPPSQLKFVAPAHVVSALDGVDERVKASVAGTVEAHAHVHKLTKWAFECAKAMHRWPEGAEVSEEEFLAAVEAAADASLR
jgi:hypothetical protein